MGVVLCLLFVFHVSNFIVNIYYGHTQSGESINKKDNTGNADSKENHREIVRNNNESHHGNKQTNVPKPDKDIKEDVKKGVSCHSLLPFLLMQMHPRDAHGKISTNVPVSSVFGVALQENNNCVSIFNLG